MSRGEGGDWEAERPLWIDARLVLGSSDGGLEVTREGLTQCVGVVLPQMDGAARVFEAEMLSRSGSEVKPSRGLWIPADLVSRRRDTREISLAVRPWRR
jgi:hypothetical protein